MGAVLDARRFRGNVHDHLVAVGRRAGRRLVIQVGLGDCRESVGPAAGVELNAFVNSLDRMPDLDDILAGNEVPVPDEIDLQYAVAAALVGRAIRAKESGEGAGTYGPILDYARRFPQREMGVMLVSDMHRAIGEDVFKVPEFADWAQAISDVMLFE